MKKIRITRIMDIEGEPAEVDAVASRYASRVGSYTRYTDIAEREVAVHVQDMTTDHKVNR